MIKRICTEISHLLLGGKTQKRWNSKPVPIALLKSKKEKAPKLQTVVIFHSKSKKLIA